MKDKYKVPGLAVALVLLLVFVLFISASASNSEPSFEVRTDEFGEKIIEINPPYLPSAQEVTEKYGAVAIDVNPRRPQGEVIEITAPLSLEECEPFRAYEAEFWFVDDPQSLVRAFVTSFVGGFALSRDLTEYLQYYDFDQDGVPRVGVTSMDFVEQFKESEPHFIIRFEIIDPDEVRHLEEAAREIDKKTYVMGASYCYMGGRITVDLTTPNQERWKDIYQEYRDLPLRFYLIGDPQPETLSVTDYVADDIETLSVTTHGGGEKIRVGTGGGTSGFLAYWSPYYHVMVLYGHGALGADVYSYDYDEYVGVTIRMIDEGIGNDAGMYMLYSSINYDNVIHSWRDVNGDTVEWTWDVDGWRNAVTQGQSMWYASGYRGLRLLTVNRVRDTYIRYKREAGGGGDSGSPLFYVYSYGSYCYYFVHGVHTHHAWWDPVYTGYGTRIGQVEDLLDVSYPW